MGETHPFWSVQDQAFVPIGHLVAGSQVLTADEQTKTITSILPRPGPAQQDYNPNWHLALGYGVVPKAFR